MNNVQMPKNLYVLCMDKRNYPPLPKLVSKSSLRSTSLKLEKIRSPVQKIWMAVLCLHVPQLFCKLRLQCLAECT